MIIRRKRVRRARYNGAPFYIEGNETIGGRRIASHEFPYLETPATEDLGRKQRNWEVAGFVTGPLYKQDAERLQNALEKEGVGILDHPYLGRNKKVRCLNYRIIEISREFGFIHFLINLCEAGEMPNLISQSLTDQSRLNQTLIAKTYEAFEKGATDAAGFLSDATDQVDALSESIEDQLAPFVQIRASLGTLVESLEALKGVVRETTAEPLAFFNCCMSALDFFIQTPLGALDLVNILNSSLDPIFSGLSSASDRASEPSPHLGMPLPKREMSQVVSESIAALSLIKMSAPVIEDKPQPKANRDRCQHIFINRCDEFLELTQDLGLFDVIQNLRSETFFTLQRQEKQRGIRTQKNKIDTNLILLTYELYGDLKKEEDLVFENDFPDPSWISKESLIEVA